MLKETLNQLIDDYHGYITYYENRYEQESLEANKRIINLTIQTYQACLHDLYTLKVAAEYEE